MTTTRQSGFTLLEALVTIVVISIGMLGLLGLQTFSLVNTQLSAARSQATIAADNIADRMRANPAGVDINAYDQIDNPSAASAAPRSCRAGASCTPSAMAAYDAWAWDKSIADQLPGGRGKLSCTTTDGSRCVRYRVQITWNERQRNTDTTGTGSQPITFETMVRP
ncbi:type IV pilus modification protein PilV [Salinisphaera sp. T31B1]|uniref:type IV pilus modification protein PilV n=1 Tax=Salinisphaera sp. T31B1 TaxID=727963 RepID=UPI003340E8ED